MNQQQTDLDRVNELHEFLQGNVPEGYTLDPDRVPHLTEDQAWTVVWYLGELRRQVPDHIERCGVCGTLFNTRSDGTCLDYGDPPYHFCDQCIYSKEFQTKQAAGGET